MSTAERREVDAFLGRHRTASLATADDDGQPHAANVQFVHDEAWRLIWVSSPQSRHSRQLASRPAAAVTIYAPTDDPAQVHGVQMHGHVAAGVAIDRPGWDTLWDRYRAKFSFVQTSEALRAAVERQQFYVFTPTWLRWIDNRRRFGWKVEWRLDEQSGD